MGRMKYTANKEQRQIAIALAKAGWRVERRGQHTLAFPPDGKSRPVTLGSAKPASRTMQNMLANIEKLDPSLKGQLKIS